jgi:hypothetical protein
MTEPIIPFPPPALWAGLPAYAAVCWIMAIRVGRSTGAWRAIPRAAAPFVAAALPIAWAWCAIEHCASRLRRKP